MRLGFIFNEVLIGLRRNITMTTATVLSCAISLALFGGGLLSVKMAEKTQVMFLDKVELQFYLDDTVSSTDHSCIKDICAKLKADLEHKVGVQKVTYMSKTDVYNDAKKVFADQKEMQDLLQENVFPAAIKVKVVSDQKFDEVKNQFSSYPGVARVLDQRQLIDRIFSVLNGIRNTAFTVAALQAIAAILLIVNTVQISAFTRKTEVGIMRLVGASRWYTQLPFIIETSIAALLGTVLAMFGLYFGKSAFMDKALKDLYGVNIIARINNSDIMLIFPWLFFVGITVAVITSYVTLRLYVRD